MGTKLIVQNKKAFFNYHIAERYEAGLVLTGSEVQSLRAGKANLVDAYAVIKTDGMYLLKAHISPYPPAAGLNHEPTRPRKLLLHREEMLKLSGTLTGKGVTLVPLSLYFKGGRAKVELGLARGKKKYDKREDMKKRESNRQMARALRKKT